MSGDLVVDVNHGVATLTIDRPDKHNALTWQLVEQLRSQVQALRTDDEVRVLVLAGAGDRAFCAGADLASMAQGQGPDELHAARGELAGLFVDLWQVGKPTVARVQGYCLAGGFGLALACDLLVASEAASFGTPEIDIGLWPFMITVPLLRSLPPKKALELMMTGRRIDAAEADALGLVSRLVAPEDLGGAREELTRQLAAKPASIMALGRDSFYRVLDQRAEDALALLHPLLSVASDFDDAVEGRTAFVEKRPPRWALPD